MSPEVTRQRPERPEQARVFFALWPAPPVAAQLAGAAEEFARAAGGRATRPETIHLTLAFLGDVPVDRLAALAQAARAVRGAAFDLTLDRFGCWPHNRIFWAGCSSVPPALGALAAALRSALAVAGFKVADGQRAFAPHLTLVRKLAQCRAVLPVCAPLAWRCTNFVLVRSTLSASGSAYRRLGEFPLEGGPLSGLRPAESGS